MILKYIHFNYIIYSKTPIYGVFYENKKSRLIGDRGLPRFYTVYVILWALMLHFRARRAAKIGPQKNSEHF